jgi:hypothetical protein
MRSVGMLGLAACLALGAASAPASAAVTFNFTQTGGTPPGALSFSGSLAVTDQAFANGLDILFSDVDGRAPATPRLDGLFSMSYIFAVTRGLQRTVTETDFNDPRPIGSQGKAYSFRFTSNPGGGPQGAVRFNDTEDFFDLTLGAMGGQGLFISDRGGRACGVAPGCNFSFAISPMPVAVPEPAAILLFGTALIGLVGLARRKAA